ncbi:EAL domain-containing protein [Paraliobacillus ryukyuensis]|uniref:EAL domain-containing protein n=1 Tax=Paraliobacillus ryukyuensis TaxID=200904 RepID=UPI0009A676C4|nr:EAL-associated domain-containing protein [Paraliobacillus ryukyuensis]
MDPLDIVSNLDKVKPVYQPIVSAIKHSVVGYELYGRYYHNGEWVSLGPFFRDQDVPEEFKVEVDQHLLHIAVTEILETNTDGLLFINRTVKELLYNNGEDLLQALKKFEKKGFMMERVVVEIMEEDFDYDFENINHLILYYKTYGIQIAVDHVGAKSSNLDRIRQLEPHILKIDTRLIGNLRAEGFQDVMYSLAMLAHRIGAALLFENIEEDFHLYFAWKHGSRYYQGFYLAKPLDYPSRKALGVDVNTKVMEYIQQEKDLVKKRLDLVFEWEKRLTNVITQWQGPQLVDEFIQIVTSYFKDESFRVYICDSDGQQVSSNFRKIEHNWLVQADQKGSNWAFRPYFLENMMQMRATGKGILSDVYSDIETRELTRTFSFPLSESYFLFIDLGYAYLFEHDCLLI